MDENKKLRVRFKPEIKKIIAEYSPDNVWKYPTNEKQGYQCYCHRFSLIDSFIVRNDGPQWLITEGLFKGCRIHKGHAVELYDFEMIFPEDTFTL